MSEVISKSDNDDNWYWEALQSKEYIFNIDYNKKLNSKKLWINYPVYKGTDYYGVVGTGVNYDLINLNLTDQTGKHHDSILHDEHGIVKVHKNPMYIDRTNIASIYGIEQSTYMRLMKTVKTDNKRIEIVFSKKNNSVVSIAWIPLIRWYLVTSISIDEYRLNVFYPFLLLQMVSLLFITGFVWRILVKQVFQPINKISVHLKRISNLDYSQEIIVEEGNELGMVAETINTMQTGLKSYSESMRELVLLRTDELERANKELQTKEIYIDNELQIAKKIQMAMIPNLERCLTYSGLDIGFKYQAMEELGGDLFDIIRYGRNGYGFFIIDVCGHGVPASLITAMVKVSFNTHAKWGISASEIMKRVNREITQMLIGTETYITACYLSVNLEDMKYEYSNAGHPSMLMYKKNNNEVIIEELGGAFINIRSTTEYEMKTGNFVRGDCFYLYTDGIIEAWNNKEEMYGVNRLKRIILENKDLLAQDAVEHVFEDVKKFSGLEKQEDDQALVFIKIK